MQQQLHLKCHVAPLLVHGGEAEKHRKPKTGSGQISLGDLGNHDETRLNMTDENGIGCYVCDTYPLPQDSIVLLYSQQILDKMTLFKLLYKVWKIFTGCQQKLNMEVTEITQRKKLFHKTLTMKVTFKFH